MKRRARGFTLIELMIVVAIIGVLAAIAIPKFAELIRKSSEGSSKGSLGALRSTLAVYYGDMEGQYPSQLASLTIGGKYLSVLGSARTPNYHADSSAETAGQPSAPTDTGGWMFDNIPGDPSVGIVEVNCTHTDTKGTVWTTY
ncbi:MAG: type IV pilin protein [Elusimicrobiota bacterium]